VLPYHSLCTDQLSCRGRKYFHYSGILSPRNSFTGKFYHLNSKLLDSCVLIMRHFKNLVVIWLRILRVEVSHVGMLSFVWNFCELKMQLLRPILPWILKLLKQFALLNIFLLLIIEHSSLRRTRSSSKGN